MEERVEKLLLFRPKIYHGESLSSYIFRLAEANRYKSVGCFSQFFNTTIPKINNNELDEVSIELLAELTNHSNQELLQMSALPYVRQWGSSFYNSWVLKNRVKYCPKCTKEKLFHKKIWSLHFITICLDHGMLLVDYCSRCNSSISMSSLMAGRCKCGFCFEDCFNKEMEKGSIYYSSQEDLQNRLLNKKVNFLDDLSLNEYFHLIQSSCHLLEGLESFIGEKNTVIEAFLNQKDRHHDNKKYSMLLSNIFWMYEKFPHNFRAVLDSFNKKPNKLKYEQKQQFEKLFNIHKFKQVKEAYYNYWLEQADNGVIRNDFSIFKKDKSILREREYLSKEEVKTQWGINYQQIEKLFKGNHVLMKEIVRGKQKRYKIEKKSLKNSVQLQKKYISRKDAAEILGIQRDSVPKLIQAGLLNLKQSPTKQYLLDRREVDNLLFSCRGKYIKNTPLGISFYDALIKFSVNGLSIVKLLGFVKARKLNPITNIVNGKLSDCYFDEQELINCMKVLRKEKQVEQGYYLTDVIKILNIGERVMRKYMDLGILVPQKINTMKDGRKHYFFNEQDVKQFRSIYLTVEQASKRFQVSQRKIRTWIFEGRLKDQTEGRCRQYLININELRQIVSRTNLTSC